jgi:uncharacterized tellurite resistance protein B-like protein
LEPERCRLHGSLIAGPLHSCVCCADEEIFSLRERLKKVEESLEELESVNRTLHSLLEDYEVRIELVENLRKMCWAESQLRRSEQTTSAATIKRLRSDLSVLSRVIKNYSK